MEKSKRYAHLQWKKKRARERRRDVTILLIYRKEENPKIEATTNRRRVEEWTRLFCGIKETLYCCFKMTAYKPRVEMLVEQTNLYKRMIFELFTCFENLIN